MVLNTYKKFKLAFLVVSIFCLTIGVIGQFLTEVNAAENEGVSKVAVINFNEPVNTVTTRYLTREVNDANSKEVDLIVVNLNTPGGLLDSTREIVQLFFDSSVPVAVYVTPSGAQAASAGTFIGSAADILAMHPVSTIGAATPISSTGEDIDSTLRDKVLEDTTALIRSIANQRGRNQQLLEQTVLESKSFSASEALSSNIADIVASDLDDLLVQLNGLTYIGDDGDEKIFQLEQYEYTEASPSFFDSLLSIIANPTISVLLISLGSLGLTIELFNFGTWIPGTTGLILLSVGIGGAGQLPLNWIGVVLVVLGIVLVVVETQVPGYGFFGVSGVVSLVVGGLFMFDFSSSLDPVANQGVIWWVIALFGALAMGIVVWFSIEFRRSKTEKVYVSDNSSKMLIGKAGIVTSKMLDSKMGEVHISGEFWAAKVGDGKKSLSNGSKVIVEKVDDLTLIVRELY